VLGNSKIKTDSTLWDRCEAGDEAAYAEMLAYNAKDVALTEQLMLEILPWITDMPHMGMLISDGEQHRCYACGRQITEAQRWSKPARAYVREYALYRCTCQAWNRSTFLTGKAQFTRSVR
jgi:hypothetical protein